MSKHVTIYDGYELFDDGKIYSYKTEKFLIPHVHKQSNQYYVNLYINKKQVVESVAKLVAEYFVTKPHTKDKLIVAHLNLNIKDNRAENLKWVTTKELMKLRTSAGIYNRSIENHKTKVKLVNRLECLEVKFDSIIEAAKYLKCASGTKANVSSISSAISAAIKRNGTVYNWQVIPIE